MEGETHYEIFGSIVAMETIVRPALGAVCLGIIGIGMSRAVIRLIF